MTMLLHSSLYLSIPIFSTSSLVEMPAASRQFIGTTHKR